MMASMLPLRAFPYGSVPGLFIWRRLTLKNMAWKSRHFGLTRWPLLLRAAQSRQLSRLLRMLLAGSQPVNVVIAIVGPTGVGKTALAVALAVGLPVEVVNADSRQIYRSMDIGTAKPSAQERAAVPHYLLDIVEPDEPLTLAQYQDRANAAIRDIH